MKSWKVVKPKQNRTEKVEEKKRCSKFKCVTVLVALVAVVYASIASGLLDPLFGKVCSHPAAKAIFSNEYFILIKRVVQLFIVRVQLLLIEAVAIGRTVLCKALCGVCALLNKIPGMDWVKSKIESCGCCKSACGFLSKAGHSAKNFASSLHNKIKGLRK
ncbi:hypothetical protein NEMIN01_1453 [Nematocida minor]|uniref:uncharacterized protein n=1 Tax=Nematocida minor TaxID=1912983 RepID=UPI002220405F|nr:uncharacterized protein NEMIN01_1453 [Nematocida minor]KAI5191294.1 hypothetical protein NEMIN01_1453 [Nematocida minor]